MPVFRIWSADRTIKKSVVCIPEVEALKKKGKIHYYLISVYVIYISIYTYKYIYGDSSILFINQLFPLNSNRKTLFRSKGDDSQLSAREMWNRGG